MKTQSPKRPSDNDRVDKFAPFRLVQTRADTLNEEHRTVDAVLTTETPVRVFDFDRWEIVEEVLRLDGWSRVAQVPLLEVHNRWDLDSVVGSVRNIRHENSELVGTLHFLTGDDRADKAWNKVRQGALTDVSVGYAVKEATYIRPNREETVAGKAYKANDLPLKVVTKWKLRESSLVPVGADELAKVRECPPDIERETTMAKSETVAESVRTETVVPTTTAAPIETVPTAVPDAGDAEKRGMEMERQRIASIKQLARNDIPAELVDRAVAEGWTLERASSEFSKAFAERRTVGPITVSDRADELVPVLTDSIVARAGYPTDDKRGEEARKYAAMRLRDMASFLLRSRGQDTPWDPDELFKRAISSVDFTQILGAGAQKVLHSAYTTYPGTMRMWAGRRSVPDFKQCKEIALGAFGSIDEVGDAGELRHGTIAEKYETFQAKTYGRRFALTRKMFINDDLGAFTRLPSELGMAMARNIDDVGYAMLELNSGVGPAMTEDTYNLFSASHSPANYVASATYALGDAGLTYIKNLMRQMKGLASEFLNLTPKFLLIPSVLEDTAARIMGSRDYFAAGLASTSALSVAPSMNPHAGLASIIVEPRLDAGTGGTTKWYLIADQGMLTSVALVYLNGQEMPVVERKDPVDVLGIGWWAYHDVGIATVDWRSIFCSKGAS